MLQGQLSELQRDKAWQGIDPAQRNAETAINYSMGDGKQLANAGMMNTARSAQEQTSHQAQDDRKKRDEIVRAAGEIALENMRRLQEELDALLEDLAEIRRQQEANDRLIGLLASGQLNRDNAEHAELIIAAGLDQSMDDDELHDCAKDQKAGLAAREDDIRTDIHRKQEGVAREAAKAADVPDVQEFLAQSNADVSAALRIQSNASEAVVEAAVTNYSAEDDSTAKPETSSATASAFGLPSP